MGNRNQESNKRLAACGMTGIFMARCGIKILWRERDLPMSFLTGGMRDSFKIDGTAG